MDTGRKINIGLFDECLLEIFKWKEQKHPRLHLFSHQLFLKKYSGNETAEHDVFIAKLNCYCFQILALLSHNEFSHGIKKECFNLILLIYLTCDFCSCRKLHSCIMILSIFLFSL